MMMRWQAIGFALVVLSGTPFVHAQQATSHAGVRDRAHLFSAEAVEKADQALQTLRQTRHQNVVIETVESLDGDSMEKRAIANAKSLNIHGLYILIAKAEHKLWIEPSRSARTVFPKDKIEAINSVLTNSFKERQFDQGLSKAVAEIESAAREAANLDVPAAPAAPVPAAKVPEVAPLARKSNILPTLLLGGVGIIILLWLLGKVFGRSRPQTGYDMPPSQPQGFGTIPPGGYGAPGGGYGAGTHPPGSGGPGPYGYGPAPGYPAAGYGAPPPRQGGGFISSALGGIGGAVVGNILYDQFGRPHTPEGHPIHGDVTGAGGTPPLPPGDTEQTHASHDPNGGDGADWGTSGDNSQPAESEWAEGAGTGGDWGSSEPADTGESGDWDAPDDSGAGGDWGGSDDTGQSGDWGDSGGDASQEGSW